MPQMDQIIQNLTVYALPLLFAITLHEAAHAYVARYFGDNTAYSQGRMSLNPVKHIDPFGTIVLPLIFFLLSSPFLIGYARPVPVDFGRLRKPKRDMAWVALAGPMANLVMALGWLILAIFLVAGGFDERFFFNQVAVAGIKVNLLLFAFNLFPLPPLDGGRILTSILPHSLAYKFARIEPYGFFILLALLFLQVLHFWIGPVQYLGQLVISTIVQPLKLLLF